MKKIWSLLFISSISFSCWANDEIKGKVISVVDGNTLEVIDSNNETIKLILAGIDSPELTQEYGDKAKKFLEKIVLEKEVVIQFHGKDRKGNQLAVVLVKGKIDLRVELLKEGLAWTSEKDPMPELEAHRSTAQEKGKGLWKENNPIPPWTYRREQTMLVAKSS